MELTGGLGADVAVEVPETFELCTELIRPGGRVANVGVHGHSATLHLEKLRIRDVLITTGLVDTNRTSELLKLIEGGRLDPTTFATHHFALADVEQAYDVFAAAADTHARAQGRTHRRTGRARAARIGERTSGRWLASPGPQPKRSTSAASASRDVGGAGRRPGGWMAFFAGLSPESLALRFHGAPDETLIAQFLEPDWAERGALLGLPRRRRCRLRRLRTPRRLALRGGRLCRR